MNERIKELAEQASKDNSDGYPVTLEYSNRFAEKFAELIIRECMDICNLEKADYDKCRKGAWDFDEKNIYSEGASACDTVKHKMKHRFGIKL
jgi:hypothetical protein